MYDTALLQQKRSRTEILFYVGTSIIGLVLVITMIVGSVNIHSNYRTTMTCITKGETVYRLPYSIKPISYSLSLKPDLMNADYNGTVDIRFIVRNETRCIVLNAEDLNFGKNDVQLFEYRTNTRISLVITEYFKLERSLF